MKIQNTLRIGLIALFLVTSVSTTVNAGDKVSPNPLAGYTIHVSAPTYHEWRSGRPVPSLLQADQRRHHSVYLI